MNIESENVGNENNKLIIKVSGHLDTTSAFELENEINKNIVGIDELKLNFKDLDYISSAGIRTIVTTEKLMEKQGKLIITNVNPFVMNIFETTGVNKILNIE
ncbi:MAG: STAS domain-containing protein [Methanobrevibacter sp.]|jgi:anti-sigma B factor antagonist|nr:STAS domain-containing protein [Methanobrevibacter sp.]